MDDFITKALAERRSLKEALTDLRAKYQRRPSRELAEMIRHVEAEISHREMARRREKQASPDMSQISHPLGERNGTMTRQKANRPGIFPLEDNTRVTDAFADVCAGVNVLNGNVHITFASVVADHSEEPEPLRRVVSARVVMPIAGAAELRDLLTQLMDAVAAQGAVVPRQSASKVVTFKKPR